MELRLRRQLGGRILLAILISLCAVGVSRINFSADTSPSYLLNFNENGASGTTWPGWTYKPGGAANSNGNYYSPGWWKEDGASIDGNWFPRSHGMNSYGSSSLAEIYASDRAPSTKSGGCLRIYDNGAPKSYQSGWWWWIGDVPFYKRGFANAQTNRLSFYMKPTDTPTFRTDGGLESLPNSTIQIGTYLSWGPSVPQEGPGNQHYYHYLVIRPGTWFHVVLDQHPTHRRDTYQTAANVSNDPRWVDSGKHYFENMITLYHQLAGNPGHATDVRIDEIAFDSVPNENDESITSVAVGYFRAADTWEISWIDMSQYGAAGDGYNSTFEVRWSASPITNANFASATRIKPLLYATPENYVRKVQGHFKSCWTQFKLPDAVERSNPSLYFAIKDVSVRGGHAGSWPYNTGDWHNAPSSLIHTIDYAIGGGSN